MRKTVKLNPENYDTPEEWLEDLQKNEACDPNQLSDALEKSKEDLNRTIDKLIDANSGKYCTLCNKPEVATKAGDIPLCKRCDSPVTLPLRAEVTQGRNEPCNCGSGRKFKNCCLKP